jgi:hypothetical protein
MAKSDRVYSTPPTSTSAVLKEASGAQGAVKLSSRSLIPASQSGACQPVGREHEQNAVEPTSIERAGVHTVSRRLFMNYVVTAAGAATSAVALPSRSNAEDQEPVALTDVSTKTDDFSPVRLHDLRMQYEYDLTDFPEIFGKVPAGFTLQGQRIEMLCYWHRKAIEVIDQLSGGDDEELNDYCGLKNRILGYVLSAPASRVGQVAAKLRAVVHEIECLSTEFAEVSIEEVLDVQDIVKLSAELTNAVEAPITPKKLVGALQDGRKLTRAGLLTRYQSFLAQELQTVSWNLYGERDYGKHVIFYDDAVSARCESAEDPFFDESRLTTRACAVLKSLEIDTENSEVRA